MKGRRLRISDIRSRAKCQELQVKGKGTGFWPKGSGSPI